MKSYNDPDIQALPLELRCCYFVQGWSLQRGTPITNIADWADQVGWLAFYFNLAETSRAEDKRLAVQKAKERVTEVIAFALSLGLPGPSHK